MSIVIVDYSKYTKIIDRWETIHFNKSVESVANTANAKKELYLKLGISDYSNYYPNLEFYMINVDIGEFRIFNFPDIVISNINSVKELQKFKVGINVQIYKMPKLFMDYRIYVNARPHKRCDYFTLSAEIAIVVKNYIKKAVNIRLSSVKNINTKIKSIAYELVDNFTDSAVIDMENRLDEVRRIVC